MPRRRKSPRDPAAPSGRFARSRRAGRRAASTRSIWRAAIALGERRQPSGAIWRRGKSRRPGLLVRPQLGGADHGEAGVFHRVARPRQLEVDQPSQTSRRPRSGCAARSHRAGTISPGVERLRPVSPERRRGRREAGDRVVVGAQERSDLGRRLRWRWSAGGHGQFDAPPGRKESSRVPGRPGRAGAGRGSPAPVEVRQQRLDRRRPRPGLARRTVSPTFTTRPVSSPPSNTSSGWVKLASRKRLRRRGRSIYPAARLRTELLRRTDGNRSLWP